jgi:3-methyladenine DNA glycosylase AlkD
MKAYMKNQFEFLCIRSPEAKQLQKAFMQEHGLPRAEQQEAVIRELWQLPEREYQYFAMAILGKTIKKLNKDDVPLLEHLITTKSWWDTVDYLAAHPAGTLLQRYPELVEPCIQSWLSSDNMWLQRTAILFQLYYKENTDQARLFATIRECAGSTQFFIRKAIGWALREYSKTEPQAVIDFVHSEQIARLSVREALKVIRRNRPQLLAGTASTGA